MLEGFAKRGWTVAGGARSEAGIALLREEFGGGGHFFAAVDVASDDSVARFCEAGRAAVGVPDLLINNAALMNAPAPLWEVGAEEFGQLLDVNVAGVANMVRRVLPGMIARGAGVVVNFSSGWGRSTSPEVAPYCATKWAVEGLTQALAQELPPGMAAVALNPGIIDTDMLRQAWGDGASAYESATAWGERAVPMIARLGPRDNGQALTV
jgi:NAD(P)-dependent dehydrogenase (short-subunit alcohol dehydrogenase family)